MNLILKILILLKNQIYHYILIQQIQHWINNQISDKILTLNNGYLKALKNAIDYFN
jgi:hypothetical protein